MSIHRFTLDLFVDDEALADHDGDHRSPPNEIEDWDVRDIYEAMGMEIVEVGESTVHWYDGEQEEKNTDDT